MSLEWKWFVGLVMGGRGVTCGDNDGPLKYMKYCCWWRAAYFSVTRASVLATRIWLARVREHMHTQGRYNVINGGVSLTLINYNRIKDFISLHSAQLVWSNGESALCEICLAWLLPFLSLLLFQDSRSFLRCKLLHQASVGLGSLPLSEANICLLTSSTLTMWVTILLTQTYVFMLTIQLFICMQTLLSCSLIVCIWHNLVALVSSQTGADCD